MGENVARFQFGVEFTACHRVGHQTVLLGSFFPKLITPRGFRSPPVGIVDQGADVPVVASGVATISELIAAELSCETMLFLFHNAPW